MFTDPIADYLTRIRNAASAAHSVVEIPSSKIKKEITRVLKEQGYILDYKVDEVKKNQEVIKIALKYSGRLRTSAIEKIQRASSPGLRRYAGVENLPRVINGLGVAIMSTSKGVMTEKEARRLNVGGEVLCYVY